MMYSTTYVAQIVVLIGFALKLFNVEIATEELTNLVTAAMVLGGALWTLYKRWKQGDITMAGVKK